MKTVAAFGQGDGYGDGKVYVCLASEMKSYTKTTATFETPEITKNAKEAFRTGNSEYDGIPDFEGWVCDLTVFYSKKLCKLFNRLPIITVQKFI